MKKQLLTVFIFLLISSAVIFAQEAAILWQDNFDDDDPPAHKNVGWIYYGEEDIAGQVIQQQDGMLYMKAGSYGGLAGVAVVETNGVPELVFDENGDPTPETMASILKNDYSDPNQEVTFQVNFVNITSSFFILATRMVMDSSRGDSDPTESPAYTLFISPLEGVVRIGRYDAELAALDPGSWTYFGEGSFAFTFDVQYWVKYYLKDGDLKVKIWEGDPEDEPAEWLIEGTDPDPRVTGKFTMFGLLGAPPGGDEMYLDNITVTATAPTRVERDALANVPTEFSLAQNYPNPFNPTTEISYNIARTGHVNLTVFDAIGRKVATLVDGEQLAGHYRVTWDGTNDNGVKMSSGVYFYTLQANGMRKTMKMILMK